MVLGCTRRALAVRVGEEPDANIDALHVAIARDRANATLLDIIDHHEAPAAQSVKTVSELQEMKVSTLQWNMQVEYLSQFPEEFQLRHLAGGELNISIAGACADNSEGRQGWGCAVGCSCGWMEHCYIKSYTVEQSVNVSGSRVVNVGMCAMSIPVLVVESLAIFAL
eukprot:3198218-Amphidinium_carterae.1